MFLSFFFLNCDSVVMSLYRTTAHRWPILRRSYGISWMMGGETQVHDREWQGMGVLSLHPCWIGLNGNCRLGGMALGHGCWQALNSCLLTSYLPSHIIPTQKGAFLALSWENRAVNEDKCGADVTFSCYSYEDLENFLTRCFSICVVLWDKFQRF